MTAVPAIGLRAAEVGYGGRAVVSDIHLELPAGRSLALVGTNGSGKSTLLRTLAGLLAPCGGTVEVLGGLPGKAPARVAYLGQFHTNGLALPIRVADVVRMGRYAGRGLVGRLDATDHAAVDDAMRRMDVEGLAGHPLRDLSGGQQQRVYIAQALARRADLVLLDEPAAGLDALGRQLLEQAIAAECARGAAVATATHDIGDAMRCDYALLLARRVVAFGPPANVLHADSLLATFGLAAQIVDGDVIVMESGHGHGAGDPDHRHHVE